MFSRLFPGFLLGLLPLRDNENLSVNIPDEFDIESTAIT